jgi:hypothetical protein
MTEKSKGSIVAPVPYSPKKGEVGDLANAVRQNAKEAGLNIDQKEKNRG